MTGSASPSSAPWPPPLSRRLISVELLLVLLAPPVSSPWLNLPPASLCQALPLGKIYHQRLDYSLSYSIFLLAGCTNVLPLIGSCRPTLFEEPLQDAVTAFWRGRIVTTVTPIFERLREEAAHSISPTADISSEVTVY